MKKIFTSNFAAMVVDLLVAIYGIYAISIEPHIFLDYIIAASVFILMLIFVMRLIQWVKEIKMNFVLKNK